MDNLDSDPGGSDNKRAVKPDIIFEAPKKEKIETKRPKMRVDIGSEVKNVGTAPVVSSGPDIQGPPILAQRPDVISDGALTISDRQEISPTEGGNWNKNFKEGWEEELVSKQLEEEEKLKDPEYRRKTYEEHNREKWKNYERWQEMTPEQRGEGKGSYGPGYELNWPGEQAQFENESDYLRFAVDRDLARYDENKKKLQGIIEEKASTS